MAQGNEPPPPPYVGSGTSASSPSSRALVEGARSARISSQGFADISKLRQEAAKFERRAFRMRQRSAHYTTQMEKDRHRATVYRERQQRYLSQIPSCQQEMSELEKELRAGASAATPARDQSRIHVNIRKLQERIARLERKAEDNEHRAAVQMQAAAEKKVQSDMFAEKAKTLEVEAAAFTQRADRMQRAAEGEGGASGSR